MKKVKLTEEQTKTLVHLFESEGASMTPAMNFYIKYVDMNTEKVIAQIRKFKNLTIGEIFEMGSAEINQIHDYAMDLELEGDKFFKRATQQIDALSDEQFESQGWDTILETLEDKKYDYEKHLNVLQDITWAFYDFINKANDDEDFIWKSLKDIIKY